MTKKKTLIELAYELLRGDILSCRMMPEAKLKISEISSRFDVSPGAVREALSRLLSENLVTFEPLKGFRAAPISCAASSDLLIARIEVESACFRISIARGDETWERLLKLSHRRLTALSDESRDTPSPEWMAAQQIFLDALVARCDNSILMQIRAGLLEQSQRYLNLAWHFAPAERDLEAEHRALLDSALARDGEAAVAALRHHVLLTRQWILEAMNSDAWSSAMIASPRATDGPRHRARASTAQADKPSRPAACA